MILRSGLLLTMLPLVALAEPVQASYDAYAAGLNVLKMDATIDVGPASYRVRLAYRTAGAFSLVVHAQQDTTVDGGFANGRVEPHRFYSAGSLRGQTRVTQIDYQRGQPVVRQLLPPNETEREPVAPERQADTVDTLSAMANLVRQVNQTGRCDGRIVTFDGRRLSELSARTAGQDYLPETSLSSFKGRALHCTFEGRQLGGFKLDEDRTTLQRPQYGNAWFAAATPGGPMIPVRISFRTHWFGDATMYLTETRPLAN